MAICDIIIPVWNQLALTRDCIDSIGRNTKDVDYRLIIIDNASDRDTAEYLRGLEASGKASVKVVRNQENLGFIKAANHGMRISEAPYVCLLNNDTIVTEGWLSEMIAIASSDDAIGLVNPSSNNLGQKPAKGEPLELFARKMHAERGRSAELGATIGFCMLIRRGLLEKIGVFDEVYGMGNFEDTDYSRRAVKAGYRCVRACGAFVYHRENSSFGKIRTFNEDFERNRAIFEFRWGTPRRVAYVLDACHPSLLARLAIESAALARDGNRVWFYHKARPDLPEHANILYIPVNGGRFYLEAAARILTKKKKFDEIVVGEPVFGRVLEALSFLHRAKVSYY